MRQWEVRSCFWTKCELSTYFHDCYLDDNKARELDETAKKLRETRSSLIRRLVRWWLDKKGRSNRSWPPEILGWQGIPDFPSFESYRDELLPPRE